MFQEKNSAQPGGQSVSNRKKPKKNGCKIAIVISFFVVVGIISTFASRESGNKETADLTIEPNVVLDTSFVTAAANPLMDLEVSTADVTSGGGDVLGTRAWVSYDRASFDGLTDDQIAEFALNVVNGAGYNWFTIDFGDGTGVVFSGCMIQAASLGQIDETGAILNTQKFLSVTSDGTVEWTLPAEETAVVESSDTVDYSSLEAMLQTVFDSNYPDHYSLDVADGVATVNLWQDGIASCTVYAATGDETTMEAWNTMVESMCSLSAQIYSSSADVGYENVTSVINVLNDENMENTLLTIVNGEVFYDAVASSTAG